MDCCPHSVERHAYNGCANCGCAVRWTEHPDRDYDTSEAGLEQNKAYRDRLAARVADLEAAAAENGQWIDHAATVEVELRASLSTARQEAEALRSQLDTKEAAFVELCFAAFSGPVTVPQDMSREVARLVNAIRINVVMRERTAKERDEYHEMLRSILALCDDSTRASLGPDAPLRAVKKLKADRDSYANSNFECQLAAERREVARLSDDCERLRALLRETTDWLAAVVDMNGKRVADYPALNARLAGIRSATTPGGDRE